MAKLNKQLVMEVFKSLNNEQRLKLLQDTVDKKYEEKEKLLPNEEYMFEVLNEWYELKFRPNYYYN